MLGTYLHGPALARNPELADLLLSWVVGDLPALPRPEVDAESAARAMIAVFQGLVLQLAWGEAVDLSACGAVVRRMIRTALLTDAALAAHPE